jgi:acyl carrier protein
MNEEEKFLLEWFETRTPFPVENDEEKARLNYFDAGLVKSLDIINLILEIEARFEIQFNELHFQDRRFVTINGLAKIIQELRKDNNKEG